MARAIWEMTPTQYRNHRIAEVRREYGCTRAEAADCVFMSDYWNEIITAAHSGRRIPNIVLDRMTDLQFYSIMKTAASSGFDHLYAGYIRPAARNLTA